LNYPTIIYINIIVKISVSNAQTIVINFGLNRIGIDMVKKNIAKYKQVVANTFSSETFETKYPAK